MTIIVEVCNGVYRNTGVISNDAVYLSGTKLHRFMDVFYLRCHPDELTPIEVSELCRERKRHPTTISSVNQKVRCLFRQVIYKIKPSKILEIGAGDRPILSTDDLNEIGAVYETADADPDVKGCLFSSNNPELEFPDNHFEMAAAVFVLHFHFYDAQIAELYRCLSPDGVFLANVYYRTQESRIKLKEAFESKGFQVLVLQDSLKLCKKHEFWLIGKKAETLRRTGKLLSGSLEAHSTR